jgi:hypothetical protein
MDNLEWNCWNLVLISSDMKGIFRSVWIVWFDTYQGASRMNRRTLDWNLWMRTMLEAFANPYTSMAYKKEAGMVRPNKIAAPGSPLNTTTLTFTQ